MKHSSLSLILLSLCLGLCTAAQRQPAPAKLVKVPGTKVSLAPPAGFVPSDQFTGFENGNLSIVVMEMPAPYSKMAETFTAEQLEPTGLTLLSRQGTSIGGSAGLLLQVRQAAHGVSVLKWIAAFGTESETVLITASFPEQLKARWSARLEKAVRGARWDEAAVTDPLAGLNYAVNEDPELKLARRVSNMLLLTKDGTLPGQPSNDPLFVISPAFASVRITDLREYAETRLRQTAQITDPTVKQQNTVAIAGLAGHEIVAEAAWKDTQAPVVVYQVVLPDAGSYFILQGFAARAEQEKYLAIFRRVAQSFRKK